MEKTLVFGSKLQNEELKPREESGKLFKYELPVINEAISFKSKAALIKAEERETLTCNEKLFEALECDKDTAYESFVIKH